MNASGAITILSGEWIDVRSLEFFKVLLIRHLLLKVVEFKINLFLHLLEQAHLWHLFQKDQIRMMLRWRRFSLSPVTAREPPQFPATRVFQHLRSQLSLAQEVQASLGGGALAPVPQPLVEKPSDEEVREHQLTRIPYQPWCEACVQGKARPGVQNELSHVFLLISALLERSIKNLVARNWLMLMRCARKR